MIANPNIGETSYNSNLKPEIQQSLEFGADLRFFDERLNLDVTYYKTNTFNQILSVGAVMESGARNQLINAGNIQNQGLEIEFEATPIRTADYRLSIGTNFTLNRGKIVELDDNIKEWQLMGGYDAGPEIWAYEGGKFGVMTSYYNSNTASPLYRFNNENDPKDPRNGKPVITYAGKSGSPNPAYVYYYVTQYEKGVKERQILGKVEPDYLISFHTSFSYKNFDLYALLDGRVGGNFYSNTYKYAAPMGTLKSTLEGRDKENGGLPRVNYKGETVYDAINLDAVFDEGATAPLVSDPNTQIDVGGLTYADALAKGIQPMMTSTLYMYNYGWGMPADLGMQDNTWLSLREISIGYRMPESILNKIGANYLRLGVTGRNLGYLVNKLTDGLNPESISSNNPLKPLDIGGVPFSRTYSINLTVRF